MSALHSPGYGTVGHIQNRTLFSVIDSTTTM